MQGGGEFNYKVLVAPPEGGRLKIIKECIGFLGKNEEDEESGWVRV